MESKRQYWVYNSPGCGTVKMYPNGEEYVHLSYEASENYDGSFGRDKFFDKRGQVFRMTDRDIIFAYDSDNQNIIAWGEINSEILMELTMLLIKYNGVMNDNETSNDDWSSRIECPFPLTTETIKKIQWWSEKYKLPEDIEYSNSEHYKIQNMLRPKWRENITTMNPSFNESQINELLKTKENEWRNAKPKRPVKSLLSFLVLKYLDIDHEISNEEFAQGDEKNQTGYWDRAFNNFTCCNEYTQIVKTWNFLPKPIRRSDLPSVVGFFKLDFDQSDFENIIRESEESKKRQLEKEKRDKIEEMKRKVEELQRMIAEEDELIGNGETS